MFGQIRISGRVASDTNIPVPNASVALRTAAGERYRALTDPAGVFALEVRAAGDYRVDVEKTGFFTLNDQAVDVAAGIELHLVLNPVREFSESVDVSSASSAVALDHTSRETELSGANLLDVPYPTTHNLKNTMRIMPGVIQDSVGGIHVSGGTEGQTLYLMDGFNISDPLTGRLESRVSVEGVQSMQVKSGQLPAGYGKGSAGVLEVNTKMGDNRLRYSATNFVPGIESTKGWRIGSWTPRLNLSGPIKRGRAWFSDSLTGQYDHTVIRELPPGNDQSTSWRYNNLLRGQVNLTPANILYAGFLANQWSAARTGISALDPAETTVDKRLRQWFFDLKDQIYLSRATVLEFGYASNRTFLRTTPQGHDIYVFTPLGRRGNFYENGTRGGSRDQWITSLFLPSFTLLGSHQLKTGMDLDRVSYDQDLQRTGFEFYSGTALIRKVAYSGDGRLGRSNLESSGYMQDSWRLRPNILAELGIRADRDSILRNWSVSPRVGVAWSPFGLENMKASGGYAITYDATPLELFTRPLDQIPLTTLYPPYGPGDRAVRSLFLLPGRRLVAPRYGAWSGGVDERIGSNLFVSIQAVRRRGDQGLTYESGTAQGGDLISMVSNRRRDAYNSVTFTVRQNMRKQYEWLASYTRSQAASNAVIDISASLPTIVDNNLGRMPWDAPNRLLSWGYLPTPFENWAIAYLAEYHTGFPFSVQNDVGQLIGGVNSRRFPDFFELNLHVERKFRFHGQLWAGRVGLNNITNHLNPNAVINDINSDRFLTFFGGQTRATVFRIRWLGKL